MKKELWIPLKQLNESPDEAIPLCTEAVWNAAGDRCVSNESHIECFPVWLHMYVRDVLCGSVDRNTGGLFIWEVDVLSRVANFLDFPSPIVEHLNKR